MLVDGAQAIMPGGAATGLHLHLNGARSSSSWNTVSASVPSL
jgi:hypothetical protein